MFPLQPDHRYDILREILKRPLKGDGDIIKLLREIGYGVLYIVDDLLSLRDIRGSLVRMEKNMIDIAKDTLAYRQSMIERERDRRPEEDIKRELYDTQDLLDKLEERRRRIVEPTLILPPAPPAPVPEPKKPFISWGPVIQSVISFILGFMTLEVFKMIFGDK